MRRKDNRCRTSRAAARVVCAEAEEVEDENEDLGSCDYLGGEASEIPSVTGLEAMMYCPSPAGSSPPLAMGGRVSGICREKQCGNCCAEVAGKPRPQVPKVPWFQDAYQGNPYTYEDVAADHKAHKGIMFWSSWDIDFDISCNSFFI